MADIIRQCAHCSQTLTVSEFADATALRCPACGQMLVAAAAQAVAGLRLKPRSAEKEAELQAAQSAVETLPFVKPDRITLWLGPDRWRALLPLAHWAVFAVLLIGLGMVIRLRFAGIVRWALYGG